MKLLQKNSWLRPRLRSIHMLALILIFALGLACAETETIDGPGSGSEPVRSTTDTGGNTSPAPDSTWPAGVTLVMAKVVKVVDGDTIDVLIDGREYRVRYILIDTPEVFDPVEPFGPEATEANRRLVSGQTVGLEIDVSETDRFGRLLRYVYLPDGRLVNEELLRQGLAVLATFPPDVKYVDRFRQVEAEARAAGAGLWAGQSSPAQSGDASLVIVGLDKGQEYADIANQGPSAVDLTGWRLFSERGEQDCPLGGTIEPGQTLRVWAMTRDAGRGGFNCGFADNVWSNSAPDAAVLFDPGGAAVSRLE